MALKAHSKDRVTLYTMEYCPYCVQAKSLLTRRSVPFEEICVADDDDASWDALFRLSGMRTMPQIFKAEHLVGGYSDLAALDQKDQLASLK
jgi:glutaredoxin 3